MLKLQKNQTNTYDETSRIVHFNLKNEENLLGMIKFLVAGLPSPSTLIS